MRPDQQQLPKSSLIGLNAANFLQAEMVGVILPFLNAFLKEANWRYDAIGLATAAAGLGTLLFQAAAGWLTDKLPCRRALITVMALITGASFVALPFVPRTHIWVDSLLFLAGAAQSFFVPLFGSLALALAGHKLLNRVIGANQGWNHAGNIVAAIIAMSLVSELGLTSVFYSVGTCSLLVGASMLLIREKDLDERVATGLTRDEEARSSWTDVLRNRTILFLFLSIFLFHLANGPILPTVALYVKKLGGSDNWMTATVLTAQVVMVPVALLTGRYCDAWGRKPVMAIAFWVLPLRIVSYAFVASPAAVVYLQGLDGIGAGIYGVAVALCSIVATYLALRWTVRKELEGNVEDGSEPAHLSREGRLAAWGIIGTAVTLICTSGFGLDLGLPTCAAAGVAVLLTTRARGAAMREVVTGVSWSVLPLVAGLFVLVEALDHAGAQQDVGRVLQWCAAMPGLAGGLTAAFGVAGLSNLMNNLPSGLLSGGALQIVHVPSHIRCAVLIGVDLGPNLSVTGSLATVLWLIALRREGEQIGAWQFLKTGLIVMPPAVLLSTVAASLLSK